MKAPEKIYVHIRKKPFEITFSEVIEKDVSNIEYTRTDAFIEKACDWLKENKDKYLYNTGERGEYIPTCSGKMIDEFRNYMKGE